MDLAVVLISWSLFVKKKKNDKLTPEVSSRANTFETCPNPKVAELK